MGQTLTHGVYLPDEGERNCYSGLAANWQILDTSVGTIAANTAALAGKAPAVHTHTKSQITDFPAFGNAAGTICEGNDSRLSDARTPVAHTHGKADITDLFNSANTWSGLNTFQGGGIRVKDTAAVSAGGYGAAIYFQDYQGNRYGYIQPYVTSDNYKNIIIGADGTGRIQVNSYLVPYAANAVNFGTSDLQWKSVYTRSLNGINPGALSLPNGNAQDTSWIGDLTIKDGSGYNLKTFTLNGWITINIPNTAGNLVVVNNGCGQIVTNEANGITGNNCAVFIPVVANVQISILLVLQTGESVKTAIFAPCLGNV